MKIVTHNGNYHADDIFAVATLLLLYPEAEVIRSRDREVIDSADIVIDTGLIYDPKKFRFDHHQAEGAGVRENGIPYASFGLIWKEFGVKLAGSQEAADIIEEKMVLGIDAIDNGVKLVSSNFGEIREYSFMDYLYSFMDYLYSFDERESIDGQENYRMFMRAVGAAVDALKQEIQNAKRLTEETQKVREIIASTGDKRVVIIPELLRWRLAVAKFPEIMYVIYPKKEGGWGVKSPRISKLDFAVRKPMPEEWVTDNREDFIKVTGVQDAQFMHKGRWYAAADTLEGAIKLAKIALNS